MKDNNDIEVKIDEDNKIKNNETVETKNSKNDNKVVIISIIVALVIMVAGVVMLLNLDSDKSKINDFKHNPNIEENTNGSNSNDTITINKENIGTEGQKGEYSEKDLKTEYNESTVNKITLKEDSIESNSSNVNIEGQNVTIKAAGEYYITGKLLNGKIVVEAGDDDFVHIILDNVDITNSSYSPFYVKNADKVTITLKENTNNIFTDGSSYTGLVDEEPNATIFSHDDLSINGNGTLNIAAKYMDGIVSKDDLVIVSSNINVVATDDGIRGKDSVQIKDANIKIEATGDGIKSTNDTDEDKGYIIIDSGTIDIKTTGDESAGAKAIQSTSNITINSGTLKLVATDDGIHSDSSIIINDGKISITSGDDGIHADNNVTINNGEIDILNSYEGIEGLNVTINNGIIDIIATDDGINGSDPKDSADSRTGNRMGHNGINSSTSSNVVININGGTIDITAGTSGTGDGLDSNGDINIAGGILKIVSPQNPRDWSTIDYENNFNMTGGNINIDGKEYDKSNIQELQRQNPMMQPTRR